MYREKKRIPVYTRNSQGVTFSHHVIAGGDSHHGGIAGVPGMFARACDCLQGSRQTASVYKGGRSGNKVFSL